MQLTIRRTHILEVSSSGCRWGSSSPDSREVASAVQLQQSTGADACSWPVVSAVQSKGAFRVLPVQLPVPKQRTIRRFRSLAVSKCNGRRKGARNGVLGAPQDWLRHQRLCQGPKHIIISCTMAAAVQDGCQAPIEAGSSVTALLSASRGYPMQIGCCCAGWVSGAPACGIYCQGTAGGHLCQSAGQLRLPTMPPQCHSQQTYQQDQRPGCHLALNHPSLLGTRCHSCTAGICAWCLTRGQVLPSDAEHDHDWDCRA